MTALYVLDVPENASVPAVAGRDELTSIGQVGPYVEISTDGPIVIDRRATACRVAVWYSLIAGVSGGRVTQHDKDVLRISPT